MLSAKERRKEIKRLETLLFYEKEAKKQGFKVIAGIDEAGRGPLAGPLVAAACVLPENSVFFHLNDSKQLTEKQREELYTQLTTDPLVDFGIGIIDHIRIDEINIYEATIEAMFQSVCSLKAPPDFLLVDGKPLRKAPCPFQQIVKGDTLSQSIAAASVIAKVTRDRIMVEYHTLYPHYGFNQHKGYATAQHLAAIEVFGPSAIHRMTFAPLKRQ